MSKIPEQIAKDALEIKYQLAGSLLDFTQTFYRLRCHRLFELSDPIGRESHYITISKALSKVLDGEISRLIINVPPRYGKSEMLINFIAWAMAIHPDSNFLYVSYNLDLAMKQTATIKHIIEMRQYRDIFGVKLKIDTRSKSNFETIQGGSVYAAGSGGTITGRGAGIRGVINRFSGAIVCFPYDELMQTELGPMQIGGVVKSKLNIKVPSYNFTTHQIEMKPIIAWHANPGDDILEVTFTDGATIRCTPGHKIWTDNRGWVEARHLLTTDTLNCISINSKYNSQWSPLLIKNVGHVDNTYCVTVEGNHNFFAGQSEDKLVLVKNCDDLIKPDEASSPTIRDSVKEWYYNTMISRANNSQTPIILLGQCVHEDDISAHLIAQGGWHVVRLPALDEVGNVLHPGMHSKEDLLQIEKHTPYVFAAQYQQNPQPSGGGIFKPEWFYICDEVPKILATFITADTAETSKTYNDASVFSFWGLYKVEKTDEYALHWLDCKEIRVEPKDLENEFLQFYYECCAFAIKPMLAVIEKKSTGVTLASSLSKVRGLNVKALDRNINSGSKTERFLAMQPFVAANLISFSKHAQHKDACIEHMRKITANQTHLFDDICDSAQMAVQVAFIDKSARIYIDRQNDSIGKQTAVNIMSTFSKILDLRMKRDG